MLFRFFTCVLLWGGTIRSFTQPMYPAATIPAALKENAHVVVRTYQCTFEVLNQGEARETEHKVFSLLDASAQKQAEIVFNYDKFTEIEEIEATVYDGAGNVMRKLKKKDIEDVKPPEYFVNDTRYKRLHLSASAYPYTIEYKVVLHHTGLLFYPIFDPQSDPGAAIEHAVYTVKMPAGLSARFKELNLPDNAKTGENTWELNNLTAIQAAAYAPVSRFSRPMVMSAPTDFTMGGIAGDMRSWESLGAFFYTLNAERNALALETVGKLQQLVADCPDLACKVKRVYDYLQANTRYFYVGMGIGGWQPAAAVTVDQYKYGDCKGLSNYTQAMLQALGIPSYYALIRAGEDEQVQFPDFPNPWFNHACLCVPDGKDTLWLECTSQRVSCGFLGDFTDNRPALLITPEGGKMVRTTAYDYTQNTASRKATLSLLADGSGQWESEETYRGILQETPAYLATLHDEEKKKNLYNMLNFKDFEIEKIAYKTIRARIPEVKETLSLRLPRIASISGKRYFLPACVPADNLLIPSENTDIRTQDVQADARGYTKESVTEITLPEGYRLESGFEPVHLNTPFGQFDMDITASLGRLVVTHKLILNNQIHPKTAYPALLTFLKAVVKAEKTKLVLVKPD